MKIKIALPPSKSAQLDSKNSELIVTPEFLSAKGTAIVLEGKVCTDSGKVLEEFALVVSGATGKLSKMSRSSPITAAVDKEESNEKEASGDGDRQETTSVAGVDAKAEPAGARPTGETPAGAAAARRK